MIRTHHTFPVIYDLVREIPAGEVASYKMVASLVPGSTARIVGAAMAALPAGEDVPWHRVLNASGKISPRDGAERQRARLEAEGIVFSRTGSISWKKHRWRGPGEQWLDQAGLDVIDFLTIQGGWPG